MVAHAISQETHSGDMSPLVADLDRWTHDSRPDLTADSEFWRRLLLLAYIHDGDDQHGLFGALHGLRCLGARLERDGSRLRLVPGEVAPAEYVDLRRRHLVPHQTMLIDLLTRIAEEMP